MPTSYTPKLNLAKPVVNGPETENTWGFDLNLNMDKLDAAIIKPSEVNETIDDRVANLIKAGYMIGVVYSDAAGTITIHNLFGPEQSQDQIFDTIKAGNNVAIAYDDVDNRITIHSLGPGGSTGPQNVFDTIHDARLAEIPAALKVITLSGYNRPGDAGPAMPCRRTPGPVTLHAGWFRTADRYKEDGFEDAVNGGYWEYVGTNMPVAVEWFGAQGDYYIHAPNRDGPDIVNPDPTDNRQAIIDASEFLLVQVRSPLPPDGYGWSSGPVIQFGHAHYWISDMIEFDRTVTLQGLGHGFYHDSASSRIYVAAGKSAFRFQSTGGPHGPGGVPPYNYGYGSAGSVIRNLYIGSEGFGGLENSGIIVHGTIFMDNCSVNGFGGHGLQIDADAAGARTNANSFAINHCVIYGNGLDGIFCHGGDANAGYGLGLNLMENGRWGINDQSFLGNSWSFCHTSGNGDRYTNYGGPYRATSTSTVFYGCYSENDQARSYAGPGTIVAGGLHGAGLVLAGGSYQGGRFYNGGMYIDADTGALEAGDAVQYGLRISKNIVWHMGTRGGFNLHNFKYVPDQGYLLEYGNNEFNNAYGITPEGGSLRRNPRVVANQFMLPLGMLIGGDWERMRWLKFGASPLADTNVDYRTGDTIYDLNARGGWICLADGINVSNWVSGSLYAVGDFRRTPAGRVYECVRVPYDPDRWTTPTLTVKPTHTTGSVMYPEPNPEIDPGEDATIPGYKTTVVPFQPYYGPWEQYVGQAWPGGFILTVTETGISYHCPGEPELAATPQRPPPIFNTPWSMPGSTVEPTHTTATAVEYPQPNPSPSGTEPATIPGYIWRYITSNPAPRWGGTGEVFIDSDLYGWSPGTLADGASSAIQSISVWGARLGDFADVTNYNQFDVGNTRGVTIVAWVHDTDTVYFQLHNHTGGPVTISGSSWYARVRRRLSTTGAATAELRPS